jgi:hypothetical protein
MALRVFHPCSFHFRDQDIRVVDNEIDGGTSIAGIAETVGVDGGGFWQADYTNADFGDRDEAGRRETLAWRAVNAGMSGGRPFIGLFCDRWNQPVGPLVTVPHSDGAPFSDGSEYVSPGAQSTVAAVVNGQTGGLNATILDIDIASEKPLIGGERFSYIGANGWSWRAAEIERVDPNDDGTIRVTFIPPIRGGIAVGDELDFDNIRCVMKRSSPATNALNMGIFGSASITLVEYMVDPDVAPYA